MTLCIVRSEACILQKMSQAPEIDMVGKAEFLNHG